MVELSLTGGCLSEREAPAPLSVGLAVFVSALINIEKQAEFSS